MATDKEIREKMISRGVSSLSDVELLAVILQESGTDSRSVELAAGLLNSVGSNLGSLARMDMKQLRMAKGLGIRKAGLLSAIFELGRRLENEKYSSPVKIRNNKDIENIFRQQIASLPHEEFWVLYLSGANTVIGKSKVSQGGSSNTTVDHKIIVKRAVELLAPSIILAHNHPSGIAFPSEDDKLLTDKIISAASLFDISVLDHLIITGGDCFSFRVNGLIK